MGNANLSKNNFFKSAQFIGSFQSIENIPNFNKLTECCFVGRSNVGKSSIINSITNNNKLAKTSKMPGRTQSINLINIKNNINIVDLPGYGYAKISKVLQNHLSELIQNYIEFRINLKHVFVLIDTKVGIKNSDIDMFDLLNFSKKKFNVILTKIDKCPKTFIENQKKSIMSLMNNYPVFFSKIFFTSAKTKYGIIDIQKELYKISQE
tara:strand:- start:8448 stop:9071 length:624 start_codon:yes stop_codon:yes gene_type:complete